MSGALRNYGDLWRRVASRFFPGASRPAVVRVPRGHGYTYTWGTTDDAGVWHADQPAVVNASPPWWRGMKRKIGTPQRRFAEDAALHEWAFSVGGATTEAEATAQEGRMIRWVDKLRARRGKKKHHPKPKAPAHPVPKERIDPQQPPYRHTARERGWV